MTNCRLSSASSAIKFCDGNSKAIRRVNIDNVVITNSNRGIAFMVFDGGIVEDVVISNLTIETRRFDWFWWGDGDPSTSISSAAARWTEHPKPNEPAAGKIRNVIIQNVIAHGTGASVINGHPDSWLEGIRLDNVKLFVSSDPKAPYETTTTALTLRQARGLRVSNLEIGWETPHAPTSTTGLLLDQVKDAIFDHLEIHPPPGSKTDPIILKSVEGISGLR